MNSEETIKLDNLWIDVVKVISKIKNDDSEKIKSMVESITEIDRTLKSHERNQMLYINSLLCSKYPAIIFAEKSGILQVSREFMEAQSLSVLSDALKAIGIQLRNAIFAEKTIQALQEAGKTAIKCGIDNYIGNVYGLYQL